MKPKILVLLQIALLLIVYVPTVEADSVISLSLQKFATSAGDRYTASGMTSPGSWVPIKVIDEIGNILVFDTGKADNEGNYSINFVVSGKYSGKLMAVVGEGSNVATAYLNGQPENDKGQPTPGNVNGGGSGGSSNTPSVPVLPAASTTGAGTVAPVVGGNISLGTEASIEIPANVLQGTGAVEVKVAKVNAPPETPSGFRLAGSIYEFSIDGKSSYNFSREVTITLSFDPGKLKEGDNPAIYYYDQAQKKWVNLGGTVSGNTVSVKVNHFTKFAVMAEVEALPVTSDKILSDISGHWAKNSITEMITLGAVSGYPDGTFKPDHSITRAEFASILVKAFNLKPQSGKTFADTVRHWAQNSITTAAYYGIVSGYDTDTFGPDDTITREQMAVMIVKAAKLNPVTSALAFTDSGSISSWAEEAMATAVTNQIINGYPDNTVNPQGKTTRAEAVTVIANTL